MELAVFLARTPPPPTKGGLKHPGIRALLRPWILK